MKPQRMAIRASVVILIATLLGYPALPRVTGQIVLEDVGFGRSKWIRARG